MNSKVSVATARTELRLLRSRILTHLDTAYPKSMDEIVLESLMSDPPARKVIERELHYLSEKNMVTIKQTADDVLHATITAHGRDFVMGEFKEIGVATPHDYLGAS